EDPLEDAALAALGRGDRGLVRQDAERAKPWLELRAEEDDDLHRRPEQPRQLVVVRALEGRAERPKDRSVGIVDPGPVGSASEDEARLLERLEPPGGLEDEAGDADAAGTVHEHGRCVAGSRLLE